MHFHVVTLFPELFVSVIEASMLKKGRERGALEFSFYDIRDHATDKHRVRFVTHHGITSADIQSALAICEEVISA